MHETVVVARRELRSYFFSPIAYVVGGLLLLVLLYFSTEVMRPGGQASMQTFFQLLPMLFILFLPALTMRLWAEERKQGTLELLMTFPVTVAQLILGKFAAVMLFLAVVLLLTLGYPITLAAFGNLDWGPVIFAYGASLLMAAAFVSVGLFFSSITRDQIIALLLTLMSLLLLFMLGHPLFVQGLGKVLPDFLVNVIAAISPYKYFVSVSRGVLDTRDLIYYACFCGFFLYLNAMVLQGRRLKG